MQFALTPQTPSPSPKAIPRATPHSIPPCYDDFKTKSSTHKNAYTQEMFTITASLVLPQISTTQILENTPSDSLHPFTRKPIRNLVLLESLLKSTETQNQSYF